MGIDPQVWIGVASAIVAGVSAVISIYALVEQRKIQSVATNFKMLSDLEQKVAQRPELLRLHNINCNVEVSAPEKPTASEVAYLISNFTAGDAYSTIRAGKYKITPYRANLARNEKVRFIWKHYIREKFISEDSPFAKAVDKFIEENKALPYNSKSVDKDVEVQADK